MKRIRVKTKRFATMAAIIATCFIIAIPVQAAYPINKVTIKVFQDKSYLDTYSFDSDYINRTMTRVDKPFISTWNIVLSPSYYNVSGMPLENCPNGFYTICDNSHCGSTCVNKYQTKNHHKNFDYNCFFARRSYGYSGYDLALLVSSAELCHINGDNEHDAGGLGMVPSTGSDFAMVKQTEERGEMLNVRVIQHELSHNFGCPDHDPEGHEQCIMSGGFDKEENFNLSNIWCDSCMKSFDRYAH